MHARTNISFVCTAGPGNKLEERWEGIIQYLKNYGSHYEIMIQSRSSILVLIGRTTFGYFACIPDWQAGCHLTNFKDLFWNTEKLSQTIGDIDGITVAQALYTISDELNSKQKCKPT